MIKPIRSVFYYGEFGYFNFMILGRMERYLRSHQTPICIRTYDDYFRILDLIFPGRFYKSDCKTPDRAERKYHSIQNHKFNSRLITSGWTPLEKILDCEITDWRDGRGKITELGKPITASACEGKRFVSVLCRKRKIDEDRNLSVQTWQKIVSDLRELYPEHKIVFHGLKEETIEVGGSILCCDIVESVKYLNESEIFISSMSGFAQFASNCNCSILQIGPSFQMIPYNPFGRKNLQLERSEVGMLKDYLRQNFLYKS